MPATIHIHPINRSKYLRIPKAVADMIGLDNDAEFYFQVQRPTVGEYKLVYVYKIGKKRKSSSKTQ